MAIQSFQSQPRSNEKSFLHTARSIFRMLMWTACKDKKPKKLQKKITPAAPAVGDVPVSRRPVPPSNLGRRSPTARCQPLLPSRHCTVHFRRRIWVEGAPPLAIAHCCRAGDGRCHRIREGEALPPAIDHCC